MDRLLIIEDSLVIQKILEHLVMQEMDCVVDIAGSLAEGRGLLADNDYSCALVDLCLPDAANGEVVELVLDAGIPTIVLTSNINLQLRERILGMGVVDYVLKENRDCYRYAVSLAGQLLRNRQIKVLVADDSVTSRNYIAQLLEQLQFQVIAVNDGAAAWQALTTTSDIQLVITDYQMPVMDGFELVTQIRSQYDRDVLPVIGLSSVDNSHLSARFIKHGANDFLSKPFIQEEFQWRVLKTMEQMELIRQIRDVSNRDYLTGLYNRRYFFSKGAPLVELANSQGAPMTVAILDLDHFKQINDTFGHDAGDAVLKQVSTLLSESFSQFVVARFGGEEFVVLLPGIGGDQAHSLMELFRMRVAASTIVNNGERISVTSSIGVAVVDGGDLPMTIRRADEALYRAKAAGRNRVEMA